MTGTVGPSGGPGPGRILATELRLLRVDAMPAIVFVVLPASLMWLLAGSSKAALAHAGVGPVEARGRIVAGMAVLFSFFIVSMVGYAVARDHGWGTWDRALSLGIRPRTLVALKVAVPLGILALSLASVFGAGVVIVDFAPRSWGGVVLVGFAYSCFLVSLGMFLPCVLRSFSQIAVVSNGSALLLGALSGALVPVETLPSVARHLAGFLPTGWAMRGFGAAIGSSGIPPTTVRSVGELLASALVLALASAASIRSRPERRLVL